MWVLNSYTLNKKSLKCANLIKESLGGRDEKNFTKKFNWLWNSNDYVN